MEVGQKKRPEKLIYSSINSRATLIDCVAYLLAYGKTFKNTACACYSSAAINRADTVIQGHMRRTIYGLLKDFVSLLLNGTELILHG